MDLSELEPRKPQKHEIGADLSALSIGELKELIATLQAEVARVEETMAAKQSSKSAADAAFKR
jgi:uncharacterized small protein (DUF1192 family)